MQRMNTELATAEVRVGSFGQVYPAVYTPPMYGRFHAPLPQTSAGAPSSPVCVLDDSALRLVLDAMAGAALVLTTDGRVVLANASGAALSRRHGADSLVEIARNAFDGTTDDYRIVALQTSVPSVRYFLLIHHRAGTWDLVRERSEQWGLSRRQTEALRCLVKGMCNKHIARELCCAVRTVELHVSAVLRAAGATSRAEAIAMFWRDSPSGHAGTARA